VKNDIPAEIRRVLSATEVVTRLSKLNGDQVPGWRLIDGSLEKTFIFPDFYETIGFVNATAFIANHADHHPDLLVSYGKCTVRYYTHDVGGISSADFYCASRIDALLD
jgi:4a-hydroxytetrahydrobiopterin dehydratase